MFLLKLLTVLIFLIAINFQHINMFVLLSITWTCFLTGNGVGHVGLALSWKLIWHVLFNLSALLEFFTCKGVVSIAFCDVDKPLHKSFIIGFSSYVCKQYVVFDGSQVEQRQGVLNVVLKLRVLIQQRKFIWAFCLRFVSAYTSSWLSLSSVGSYHVLQHCHCQECLSEGFVCAMDVLMLIAARCCHNSQDVRLSVHPSVTYHYYVAAKHVIIFFFTIKLATPFKFFQTRDYGNIPMATPLTEASNATGYEKNDDFWPVQKC